MSATKVKLPSIAELTSNRRLPVSAQDLLPLLLIFKAPLASRTLPPNHMAAPPSAADYATYRAAPASMPHVGAAAAAAASASASVHPAHMVHPPVASHAYQQYYSYSNVPPPYYLHSYSPPVYYLPVQRPAQQFAPQEKTYVAEVINKPMNKCHRCGTTETPEWRRGPNGLRTLCNACGLFHAKLVKRKGAALAAEEVLNNKVCKGKNGRRVLIKKQAMDESKKRMREAQVTEIPPIPYGAPQATEYLYEWGRVALPPPVIGNAYQPLPPLRN